MQRRGIASLPLHSGKSPKWLFNRMVNLAEGIVEIIINEYNQKELIRRLSDPFWFQALSCTLGFDWHSSGTTTVTCGVLKEVLTSNNNGMCMAGGKGKTSRYTIEEINKFGDLLSLSESKIRSLSYASRMAAKVDSAALQDNYQLYHHNIIFEKNGTWAVIQQGMNHEKKMARRYHWLSENLEDYVEEPHYAILGCKGYVLDMTAKTSRETKKITLDLIKDHPRHLKRDWKRINLPPLQSTLDDYKRLKGNIKFLSMPKRLNWKLMKKVYEFQPKNFENFLSIKGIGSSTIRALALISDLIYGCSPSWEDPIKYTFTVGGKDGVPYPVDKKVMDTSIYILKRGIEEANIGKNDKLEAIKRLRKIITSEYDFSL